MADDFAGLKTAIHDFLDAVPLDKGILYGREDDAQLFRQWAALFRAKCVSAGVTGM